MLMAKSCIHHGSKTVLHSHRLNVRDQSMEFDNGLSHREIEVVDSFPWIHLWEMNQVGRHRSV